MDQYLELLVPRSVHLLTIIVIDGVRRPAGGNFTVEMSGNRGLTTFSFGGRFAGVYPDGHDHPDGLGDNKTWSAA